MIQAGTTSRGSACTVGVCGTYWISSIKPLRQTTLPAVVARWRPTAKSSVPAGGAPVCRRCTSSTQSCAPRRKFMPPSLAVRRSTSGLVQGRLAGEAMSSHWRVQKVISSPWCRSTPQTPRVASAHQASCMTKACCITLKGQCCQSGPAKRRSGSGGRGASVPCQLSRA
jgi:hypothetical protein